MPWKFNVFTGTFDIVGPGRNRPVSIPELTSDPSDARTETAWILRSGAGTGTPLGILASITVEVSASGSTGSPMGLLLVWTYAGSGVTYQFSYKTLSGSIVRETLTS